jgi:hypothetical protein
MRIACSLGLHQESSNAKYSVFDQEMRRRLWWHIVCLDFIASFKNNCINVAPMTPCSDTMLPRNVNDADLDPSMETLPLDAPGATEMSLSLARSYILTQLSFLCQNHTAEAWSNPAIVEELVDRIAFHINDRYMNRMYADVPLVTHVFAALSQHLSIGLKIMVWVVLGRAGHGSGDSRPTSVPWLKEELLCNAFEMIRVSMELVGNARFSYWSSWFRSTKADQLMGYITSLINF